VISRGFHGVQNAVERIRKESEFWFLVSVLDRRWM
jgi:hypothetical protein